MALEFLGKPTDGTYTGLPQDLNHTRPPFEAYALPNSGTSSTTDYLQHLKSHPFEKHITRCPIDTITAYSFIELYVIRAWHLKLKTKATCSTNKTRCEYVILEVKPPFGSSSFLQLERNWENPSTLESASAQTKNKMEYVMTEKNETEALAVDSFNGALDTITLVDALPPCNLVDIVEQVSFAPTFLPLLHAICMATVVSSHSCVYSVFVEQCHLYAYTFMELLKLEASDWLDLDIVMNEEHPETVTFLKEVDNRRPMLTSGLELLVRNLLVWPQWFEAREALTIQPHMLKGLVRTWQCARGMVKRIRDAAEQLGTTEADNQKPRQVKEASAGMMEWAAMCGL